MTASQETKEAAANLIAEQIHNGLITQTFYDWYNTGGWDAYLQNVGDEEAKKNILKQIKSLFKLN